MIYSKESIVNISEDLILEQSIKGNPNYDWIDIVAIPQRPGNPKRSLFFATHSEGEGGWDSGFDRRSYALQTARDKKSTLAVDDSFTGILDVDYLRVNSLEILANRLYSDARSKTKPFVVGVTGSVGKTTSVAFLEHVLKTNSMDVTRFYSKRLTPLSVVTHYINRVNQDSQFVVMEYSAYLKNHVSKLSSLLPPDISFLLNIYDTHINPGMFANKKEIFDSKVGIKPEEGIGFINNNILSSLNLSTPLGWRGFNLEIPDSNNTNFPPTIRTFEMYTIGKLLAEQIGVSQEVFLKAFESFVPQENRIISCDYYGKKIFFHGETSGGSRLWSWFETVDNTTPWFLVEEINFADEDPSGFMNLLDKVFSSDKTLVLDTPENRKRLPVDANFVSEDVFRNTLSKKTDGYIVYHKALAVRKEGFDPHAYLVNRW